MRCICQLDFVFLALKPRVERANAEESINTKDHVEDDESKEFKAAEFVGKEETGEKNEGRHGQVNHVEIFHGAALALGEVNQAIYAILLNKFYLIDAKNQQQRSKQVINEEVYARS